MSQSAVAAGAGIPVTEAGTEIPVIRTATLCKKTPMVVGVITAGALIDRAVVPRRDFRKKTGYQREASTERINRLMQDLNYNRVDLPTGILLNLREYTPSDDLIERGGKEYFCLSPKKLYIVDGQHRFVALARLVQNDPERWSNFEIPFVCMLGADEREEMRQFYVVNSTAKSVRTDLALDLLKQQAESDKNVMDSLIERGEQWKVEGQTLSEKLAQTPVWQGRIRFPGEPKADTIAASSGLVASFKPLLGTPYFGTITTDNQIKILDAYWQGIRKVIPEAFNKAREYTLQKSTGVMIMHVLLIPVIEYLRSKGKSVLDPECYGNALQETLLNLEGDTVAGEPAVGADFWKVGPGGAAGSFSSNSGRRVLVAKIKASLPKVEVE